MGFVFNITSREGVAGDETTGMEGCVIDNFYQPQRR